MPPAQTAQNDNTNNDDTDSEDINELDTELSEEQEQAFVYDVLGIDQPDISNKSKNEEETQESEREEQESSSEEESNSDEESDEESDSKEFNNEKQETQENSEEEKTQDETIEPVKIDDLWIEVDRIAKDEDGNEKIEKIKLIYDPDDPASFIPDDFVFKTDKQLFEILEAKAEMASLYKERQSEYKEKIKSEEEQNNEKTNQEKQIEEWDMEIQSLIDGGYLDKPKAKPEDKNFKDDPAVQKVDAIFKYMAKMNQDRLKDGKQPIKSFTFALNQYNKVEEKRKKGAMVGGSSATSGGEKSTYKSGQYSNIWEVPVEY